MQEDARGSGEDVAPDVAPFLRLDELRQRVQENDATGIESDGSRIFEPCPMPEETVLALWDLETELRRIAQRERTRSQGIARALLGCFLFVGLGLWKSITMKAQRRRFAALGVALEREKERSIELAGFDKPRPDPAARSYLVAFVRTHAERVCMSLAATPRTNPWARLCAEDSRLLVLFRWFTLELNYVRGRNERLRLSLIRKGNAPAQEE